DAAVPIHNNLSERALRVIALMRKNSLFAGTDEAAQRFAQLLSLLATCQMHDVNPEHWLADVLIAIGEPGLIAEDLLPWNWKETRGPKYRPYYDTT
ncbi:MAG: transposase, partial [Kiritimatiellia bacterium]